MVYAVPEHGEAAAVISAAVEEDSSDSLSLSISYKVP
jgi:hypothetical protein